MAQHNYTITLKDDTNDGRFSESNIAKGIEKAANETKTTKGVELAAAVGGNLARQTQVGSAGYQVAGIAKSMASPVGIALTALALSQKVFNEWRKFEQEKNEWQNTFAIQYGVKEGNLRDMRTSAITGKIRGTTQGGGRR